MAGVSKVYYNENDKFCVRWLRRLIEHKLIAQGDVDDRSIADVQAKDLDGYAQCHFFAGIGGWSFALRQAGWPDNHPVWTGSCPCQPFSNAGRKNGFADDRHLWPVWKQLIQQRTPSVVFGEQVASATAWLGLVRSDLEALDYAVGAMPVQAASAGADHLRDRYWFVAHNNNKGPQGWQGSDESADQRIAGQDGVANASFITEREPTNEVDTFTTGRETRAVIGGSSSELGNTNGKRCNGKHSLLWENISRRVTPDFSETAGASEWVCGADGKARRVKPGVRLLADGIPNRVGKLRGLGNAIDHRPAAAFISAYMDCCNG